MRKMLIAILFCSVLGYAQKPTPKAAPTPAPPEISTAFSKAAIKALLTIQKTSDERLVDAAMIDENAEESGVNEKLIGFYIEAFKVGKHTGEKLIELGADPGVDTEGNQSKCVAAWLAKLRALSKAMPKECDYLMGAKPPGQNESPPPPS